MIEIKQTCDGCGADRALSVSRWGDPLSIEEAARQGGWREVRQGTHLCTGCIAAAVA